MPPKRLGRRRCVRNFYPRQSADDEEDGHFPWDYYRAQNSGHQSLISICIERQVAGIDRCSTHCTVCAQWCSASVILLPPFSFLQMPFPSFLFNFLRSFIINRFSCLSYSTQHPNDRSPVDIWISIEQWKCSSLIGRSIFSIEKIESVRYTYPWVWINRFTWMISYIRRWQVRGLVVASLLPMIESRFSIQCVLCPCRLPYSWKGASRSAKVAKVLPRSEIKRTGCLTYPSDHTSVHLFALLIIFALCTVLYLSEYVSTSWTFSSARSLTERTNERTHAQLRIWTERMNFSSSSLEYINNWISQSRYDVS